MQYVISINGSGYKDHVIKEDGTLVSKKDSRAVLVTYIDVLAPGGSVSNAQYFALFTLITVLNKELRRPIVSGNLTWDEIVDGAKK